MLEEVIIFLILYAVLVFTELVPIYKAKRKENNDILHRHFCTCVCIAVSHYF